MFSLSKHKIYIFFVRKWIIKHLTQSHKLSIPTCFVYKECDGYPIYITKLIKIVNYRLKIFSLDEHSPLKTIYIIALGLNETETNVKPVSYQIEKGRKHKRTQQEQPRQTF